MLSLLSLLLIEFKVYVTQVIFPLKTTLLYLQTPLSVGLYFYDTLRIFLDVVNETSHTGEDPTSGKFVFDKMRNIIIEGETIFDMAQLIF